MVPVSKNLTPEVMVIISGRTLRNARLLLLKWRLFHTEVAKYLVGKREKAPSWKTFLEQIEAHGLLEHSLSDRDMPTLTF